MAIYTTPDSLDFEKVIAKIQPLSNAYISPNDNFIDIISGLNLFNNYYEDNSVRITYDELVDLVKSSKNYSLNLLIGRVRQIIDSKMQSSPFQGLFKLLDELDNERISPLSFNDNIEKIENDRLTVAFVDIRLGLEYIHSEELFCFVKGILFDPAPLLRCSQYKSRRQAFLTLYDTSCVGSESARDKDVSQTLLSVINELQDIDVWLKTPLTAETEKCIGRIAISCTFYFWLETNQRRDVLALASKTARKLASISQSDIQIKRLVCMLIHVMDITLALGIFDYALRELLYIALQDKAVRRVLRNGDKELHRLLKMKCPI